MSGSNFVVCLRNAGYEASLDRGERYRLLPDAEATRHRQVRVVDESGEDYLYPESCFARIDEITICCADIGSVRRGGSDGQVSPPGSTRRRRRGTTFRYSPS